MVKQDTEFEDELLEEVEESEEEERVKRPRGRPRIQEEEVEEERKPRGRPIVQNSLPKETKERYTYYFQQLIEGIKDEESGAIIAEGFASKGELQVALKILNIQEEIRKNTYVT